MTGIEHNAIEIFIIRGHKREDWDLPEFSDERQKCLKAADILTKFFDRLDKKE